MVAILNWFSRFNLAEWLNFAGFFFGIAGVVLAIVFYYLQKRPKHLDYRLVSSRRVGALWAAVAEDRAASKATGIAALLPHLIVLQFLNSGKAEISPADFTDPIKITIPDARILAAEVTHNEPETRHPAASIDVHGKTVVVNPILMNPGDWFELQMFTSGPVSAPEIAAGVAGISSLRDLDVIGTRSQRVRVWATTVGVVVLALLGLTTAWLWLQNFSHFVGSYFRLAYWLLLCIGGGAYLLARIARTFGIIPTSRSSPVVQADLGGVGRRAPVGRLGIIIALSLGVFSYQLALARTESRVTTLGSALERERQAREDLLSTVPRLIERGSVDIPVEGVEEYSSDLTIRVDSLDSFGGRYELTLRRGDGRAETRAGGPGPLPHTIIVYDYNYTSQPYSSNQVIAYTLLVTDVVPATSSVEAFLSVVVIEQAPREDV